MQALQEPILRHNAGRGVPEDHLEQLWSGLYPQQLFPSGRWTPQGLRRWVVADHPRIKLATQLSDVLYSPITRQILRGI